MKVKLEEGGKTPTQARQGDAGYDLYANSDHKIYPGEVVKVSCGVAMEIPEGVVGLLFARSGLGINKRITPANCVGVIDSGFRNTVVAALTNDSNDLFVVTKGDRVAQMVFVKHENYDFEVVDELSESERGLCGLGSTGK